MITRIKINGFKSLLDTELFFGPFTCIAGENATGKSNLFDAVRFLSNLADGTILQAAKSIRGENQKYFEIKDIFFRSGLQYMDKMSFEIDMIVPEKTEDDLGQSAEATITSLKYELELRLNEDYDNREPVEIVRESLIPITQTEARSLLCFERRKEWVDSILKGRRGTNNPFISTKDGKIKLHQDGSKGRSFEFISEKMPRTLLSTVTAESPTAFLARYEMRNWVMLYLEPEVLRRPDSIFEVKNKIVPPDGYRLPATMYRLDNARKGRDIYRSLTKKAGELTDNIDEIFVEKDEKRDMLTLHVRFKHGLVLPAHSLSDGLLRFLGLAVIREDSGYGRLICIEEPENGISPGKIEEMVQLLTDIATDTDSPVDDDNPLRQVIINTHSQSVVNVVWAESLYLAVEKEIFFEPFSKNVKYTSFKVVENTWKAKSDSKNIISHGEILPYFKLPAGTNRLRAKVTVAERYSQLPIPWMS